MKRQATAPLRTLGRAAGALLIAVFFTANAEELQQIHLNVLGSWSTVSQHPDHEIPFWAEMVPEASGGQITTDVTAFNLEGVGSADVYEVVGQGLFEIGATVAGYMAGEDPRIEGLDLPAIAIDLEVARTASDAYKPILQEVFSDLYGVKLLALVPYSAQVVYCNTEINSLEDFEGKRIRGSGRMGLRFIEAAGAVGVHVDFAEVPVALERGVVDCAITGALSGYDNRWYEVSTHLFTLPAGGWDHVGVVISEAVWDTLNEATQDFLLEQAVAYEDRVWGAAPQETEDGIACNTAGPCPHGEAGGMTLVEVTDEDEALAEHYVLDEVLPSWADRCGAECVATWNETVGAAFDLFLETP